MVMLTEITPRREFSFTEGNEAADKLKEIKDKIFFYLQEAYANNKINLQIFLKRYYLAVLALVMLSYLYYYNLPEQVSLERFIEMKANSNIN